MADPGPSKKSKRLSREPPLDEDFHFPPLKTFNPPDKLPTHASIIGRLRKLIGKNTYIWGVWIVSGGVWG